MPLEQLSVHEQRRNAPPPSPSRIIFIFIVYWFCYPLSRISHEHSRVSYYSCTTQTSMLIAFADSLVIHVINPNKDSFSIHCSPTTYNATARTHSNASGGGFKKGSLHLTVPHANRWAKHHSNTTVSATSLSKSSEREAYSSVDDRGCAKQRYVLINPPPQ